MLVLDERNVMIRSRLLRALPTVIVRSVLISNIVSWGTFVIMWMVCLTTMIDVMTRPIGQASLSASAVAVQL